jgi:hypothetical protein
MKTVDPGHEQIVAVSKNLIAEFIDDLTAETRRSDGRDRRSEKRYPVAVPVTAIPIEDFGLHMGAAHTGVTHNISESSIAIYLTARLDGDYVLLAFERPDRKEFRLVAQITHRRRIGRPGKSWEGSWLLRMTQWAWSFDDLLRLFRL